MLLTNSDVFMYNMEAKIAYEDFYRDKKLFGFSNQQKFSKCCKNVNSLVAGKSGDETCGKPIKGFVGLKSKMYTFITKDKL